MEAASENPGRRKRGRPKVHPEVVMSYLGALHPEVRTERHRSNIAYRFRAIRVLKDDPAFTWLCDYAAMARGDDGAWKPGILAELGRVEDEQDMRSLARQLCELRPRAKNAVLMIRRWRTGRAPRGDPINLTSVILKAIDDYRLRHEGVSDQLVLASLENAMGYIIDTDDTEPAANGGQS